MITLDIVKIDKVSGGDTVCQCYAYGRPFTPKAGIYDFQFSEMWDLVDHSVEYKWAQHVSQFSAIYEAWEVTCQGPEVGGAWRSGKRNI